MLAFLILAVTFGLGFASGYQVRDLISRRRRQRHWRGGVLPRPAPQPQTAPPGDLAINLDGDLAINLDGLLVAANDDVADARRRQQHERSVERSEKPDDFDGAVRDLLSELNRRSSQPPEPARRVRH
jgi:hypothetical protein